MVEKVRVRNTADNTTVEIPCAGFFAYIGLQPSIDFAPASGYARSMIQAVPGYAYVFEIVEGSTVRYGALRMTHVGRDYLIFDWSFQTDPGNPELTIRAGQSTAMPTGTVVSGSK